MIPQSFIQDLLARADIVDVVGRHVQLKKGGINFMGLCPFHSEKSPSFTVSPTKQFYHCFGCGAHGTAVGFLMEYSGIGFVEAIKELAQNYGMVVPEDDRMLQAERIKHEEKSLALSEVMTQACAYYRSQLRLSSHAIEYLKRRGLTGEIAARFGLGYATEAWDGLRSIFPDYELNALVEAGLVIEKVDESGSSRKRYDRFRDRIMFPIRNTKGQVIGFGGRIIDKGEPKYLNSPETPLFQKGQELYGLFEGRQAIRDAGYVLVTEGYMDVVALAQLGFPQAVATLGTACTATHVQKLLRHTDCVIFSFDGDSAGRRAARRALEACLPYVSDDKIVKFLFLPTEHDPDSYVRQFGDEAFTRQIQDALPLSQFFLNEILLAQDLGTAEGRARAQFQAKPLLQSMRPSLLRQQILRDLALRTHVAASDIEQLLEIKPSSSPVSRTLARVPRSQPMGLERQAMRLLLAHPVLALELDDQVTQMLVVFVSEYAEPLKQLIALCRSLGERANFAMVVQSLREYGGVFDSLIADIARDSESSIDVARMEFFGALRQIKKQVLEAEQKSILASGQSVEEISARYREIAVELEALRQEVKADVIKS